MAQVKGAPPDPVQGPRRHRSVVREAVAGPRRAREGHWLNRIWDLIVSSFGSVAPRLPFWRFVLHASPWTRNLLAQETPVIFTCTHQDIYDSFWGLTRLFPERRFAGMTSLSRDGALAARLLGKLGYEVVRGSSSRGGGPALLKLRHRVLDGCSAVFACDGPKAPLGDVKPGVVQLARGVGAPILPLRSWGMARLRFDGSWSRATLSLPLTPTGVFLGSPIQVPREATDLRPYQLRLARELAMLARRSSVWAGGPPVCPFTVAEE